jgi:DNA-binding NarL/FixJ family response regulator
VTGDGPTTVLLVDDHPLVRQGLQAVLSVADDITVMGEASDGRAAVELAAELEPDVIIMDLQLPGLHGIDATREIVGCSQRSPPEPSATCSRARPGPTS